MERLEVGGWKGWKVEVGGLEVGGLEGWRVGGLEGLSGGKVGGLEGWRARRLEGPLSQSLAPTFKHPDLNRLFIQPLRALAFGRPPYI